MDEHDKASGRTGAGDSSGLPSLSPLVLCASRRGTASSHDGHEARADGKGARLAGDDLVLSSLPHCLLTDYVQPMVSFAQHHRISCMLHQRRPGYGPLMELSLGLCRLRSDQRQRASGLVADPLVQGTSA